MPAIGSLENSPMRIRDSSHQLAVNVNRAAAHAGNHAGVFDLGAVQSRQDDVRLGSGHAAQSAQDLDIHGFRLGALEHGVGNAVHAGLDLAFRHDFDFAFYGRGGQCR